MRMTRGRPIDFDKIQFVFLDRDGVLNEKPAFGGYITNSSDFRLLQGVGPAVAALNRSGRTVIVVTNQRGIALGLFTQDNLLDIHQKLQRGLAAFGAHLDGIYFCPHDAGQCRCRKPMTGMFEQAAADFPAAGPHNSIMIGDSLRDIEAGKTWGMATVFVTGDHDLSDDKRKAASLADDCVLSLAELVNEYVRPHIPDQS